MAAPEMPNPFRPLLAHPAVAALGRAAGARPVHLVGGVLRDCLLGLATGDIDAVVAGDGEGLARELARLLPARLVPLGGDRFAAWRLVAATYSLDLWDRGEASLEADLARRDLTLNALALPVGGPPEGEALAGEELAGGALVDPFGGVADLRRGLLRATTRESFRGDPLRVLRLVRLALTLPGMEAEAATVALAREAARELPRVAAERVREELGKIFAAPAEAAGSRALALLAAVGLYPGLWLGRPGAARRGDPARAERAQRWSAGLEQVAGELGERLAALPGRLDLAAARRAVSLGALGSPAAAEAALGRWRQAGYLGRQDAADAAQLLAGLSPPRGTLPQRRFLHRAGELGPTALLLAAGRCRAEGDPEWLGGELPALLELAERRGAELASLPRLLTGEEAQELLGVGPGPELGKALAALRRAQVDGEVSSREEAVSLLRRLRRRAGEARGGEVKTPS